MSTTILPNDTAAAAITRTIVETVDISVPEEASGERLDRVLAAAFDGRSRSFLKRLIEDRCVTVAGSGVTIVEPSYRVKPHETFRVSMPEPAEARPQGETIPLNVVYEDAHLIVIDKPSGLVVHPAPGNQTGTLVNALIARCGNSLTGIGGERRPGIVHRLDKDTSGLLVAAKTAAAHESLANQFSSRSVDRAYLTLVWGVPRPSAGEIGGNIGRSPRNRKKMAVRATGGKPALTHYRSLEAFGDAAALVECRLATGRTHQIRVNMAHIGHPVMGDPVYGGGPTQGRKSKLSTDALDRIAKLQGQALHARRLGFVHPDSGKNWFLRAIFQKIWRN